MLAGRYPARLILDTGAEMTLLIPETAHRAGLMIPANAPIGTLVGLGGEIQAPMVRLSSLQVGAAVVDNITVAVAALPRFEGVHDRVDGLLGSDVLGQFRVTLDRPGRLLLLEASR
jgi:predicted aspartyl protease